MCGQRKACQSIRRDIELVHVTARQQGRLGSRREALDGLEIAVRGSGNGRFHFRANHVGELFHADHQGHIHVAAEDGQVALAQRSTAGGAACFNRLGLDPGPVPGILETQPGKIGQQGAQVRLVGQVGSQHVAHIKRLRAQAAGILDGRQNDFHCQGAQGYIPVFADGSLTDSGNDDICHIYFIAILPRRRA